MRVDRLTIPAHEPTALSEWYALLFGAGSTGDSNMTQPPASTVELGDSTLEITAAEEPSPVHLAVRLCCEPDEARDWLAERATLLPVEGESSRYFEFLDATALYFADPAGNVLEALCYAGDRRPTEASSDNWIGGITEIGLPAPEPLALVEWLDEAVGLSAWGSPSETFAWVGNRAARFVIVPAERSWYPTDWPAKPVPISVRLSATTARPGRYCHPTLPYEFVVE